MKTTRHALNLIVPVVVIVLSTILAKAEPKLINLGALDGDSVSTATAINDRGEIVGDSSTSSSPEAVTHAFYYRNGLMRSLSSKPCNATAINDAGQIVGNFLTYTTNIFIVYLPVNPPLPPIIITNIPVYPIYPITNIIGAYPTTNILIGPVSYAANTMAVAVPNQNVNAVLTTNLETVTNLVISSQPVLFRPGSSPNLFEGTNNVSFARGINNQGEIVGGVTLANLVYGLTQYAFVYENGLTMDLPELSSANAPFMAATAINNNGGIVGYSAIGLSPEHPFLYSQGLMQDLGTLGGSEGAANSINDLGEIVGFSTTTSNAEQHAFLHRQGQMIDLGGLPSAPTTAYGFVSSASAINNWGQIVGNAQAYYGAIHAFIYQDGRMFDLNDLVKLTHVNGQPGFLALVAANGINDLGQIVGSGTFWDGRQETTRAFLLDLPPEHLPGMDYIPAT
jgi:probable HAF family extracellular repeat protein